MTPRADPAVYGLHPGEAPVAETADDPARAAEPLPRGAGCSPPPAAPQARSLAASDVGGHPRQIVNGHPAGVAGAGHVVGHVRL